LNLNEENLIYYDNMLTVVAFFTFCDGSINGHVVSSYRSIDVRFYYLHKRKIGTLYCSFMHCDQCHRTLVRYDKNMGLTFIYFNGIGFNHGYRNSNYKCNWNKRKLSIILKSKNNESLCYLFKPDT